MAQKSILVADDDASIRSLLRQLLTDEGYSITEAATGTEVVSQVSAARRVLARAARVHELAEDGREDVRETVETRFAEGIP